MQVVVEQPLQMIAVKLLLMLSAQQKSFPLINFSNRSTCRNNSSASFQLLMMLSILSSSSCNQYEFDRKIELLVLLPASVPEFTARNTVKPITRESDCGVVCLVFPFNAATFISKLLFGLTVFIDKFDSPTLGPCDDEREHPPPIECTRSRSLFSFHAFYPK
jgi:hypothetical protein